jgi:hypothetical protein
MDVIYDELVERGRRASAAEIAAAARSKGIPEAEMREAADMWLSLGLMLIEGSFLVFSKFAEGGSQ